MTGINYNMSIVTIINDPNAGDPVCEFSPKDLLFDGLNFIVIKEYDNGEYTGANNFAFVTTYSKVGNGYQIKTSDGQEFFANSYDEVFTLLGA